MTTKRQAKRIACEYIANTIEHLLAEGFPHGEVPDNDVAAIITAMDELHTEMLRRSGNGDAVQPTEKQRAVKEDRD